MSFMQPQFCDYSDVAEFIVDENGLPIENDSYTHAWRLSAPGYLDCTDWTPAQSLLEAISDCLGMYGDDMDLEDLEAIASELDGFQSFRDDYLMGLAFTAQRQETESSEPQPLFSNPGGDIADVVDVDNDVWANLSDEQKISVTSDCLNFLIEAMPYMADVAMGDAGSDFHLSRNGHGAGFFDRPYTHAKKLQEIARGYGECELSVDGKHIDSFEREGFKGSDRCLETSFFEYGLMWSPVDSDGGERQYCYPSQYKGSQPTHYNWGWFADDLDVIREFNWVKFPKDLAPLGVETSEQLTEWLKLPTPQKILDLVGLFGTENVFGTDTHEGNSIVCDDTQIFNLR